MVQIRIKNATYKRELAEALFEILPRLKQYNDCVQDFDQINLGTSVVFSLQEAERLRSIASTLNIAILVYFSIPIVICALILAFGERVDHFWDKTGKNAEEWIKLYKKMN